MSLRASTHLIFIALALFSGCTKQKKESAPATPPVRIFTLPEPGESPFRSFPGEVTAGQNVRLSFDVSGRLIDFPVYDGKLVMPGDLVGQLDPADFRASLDAALTTFHTAEQEFQRQRQLRERQVISESEFDRHRETFERAEADLRTAQKAFDDTKLSAPIKGRVSRRFVRNFQNVPAGEPVILLQDVSSLDVDIHVPESLMTRIGPGASAADVASLVEGEAEFGAIPGERFPLTLRSFATQAHPSSRTFLVSFRLRPPEDRNILPGMTSNVHVRFKNPDGTPLSNEGLHEIPLSALATIDGGTWVWKWDSHSGKVARIPVEMVSLAGGSVQVRSSELKANDEIVASGVRFLSDGMEVRRMESAQ